MEIISELWRDRNSAWEQEGKGSPVCLQFLFHFYHVSLEKCYINSNQKRDMIGEDCNYRKGWNGRRGRRNLWLSPSTPDLGECSSWWTSGTGRRSSYEIRIWGESSTHLTTDSPLSLLWWKRDIHSVEIILCILNVDLFLGSNIAVPHSFGCWAAMALGQTHDHEWNNQDSTVCCVAKLWCLVGYVY